MHFSHSNQRAKVIIASGPQHTAGLCLSPSPCIPLYSAPHLRACSIEHLVWAALHFVRGSCAPVRKMLTAL